MGAWRGLSERLFALRGLALLVPTAGLLAVAHPEPRSWVVGGAVLGVGLVCRAWAFAHLGGGGRTRAVERPPQRVRSGPYRWVEHPVYGANLLMAGGLVVIGRPPVVPGLALLAGVAGFYVVLARREGRQLIGVPDCWVSPRWSRVPRWERSTWATTAALVLALTLA